MPELGGTQADTTTIEGMREAALASTREAVSEEVEASEEEVEEEGEVEVEEEEVEEGEEDTEESDEEEVGGSDEGEEEEGKSDGDDGNEAVIVDEEAGTISIPIGGEAKSYTVDELAEKLKGYDDLVDRDTRSQAMFKAAEDKNKATKAIRKERDALKAEVSSLSDKVMEMTLATLEPEPLPRRPKQSLYRDDPERFDELQDAHEAEVERITASNAKKAAQARKLEIDSIVAKRTQPSTEEVDDVEQIDAGVLAWHAANRDLTPEVREAIQNRAGEIYETDRSADKRVVLEQAHREVALSIKDQEILAEREKAKSLIAAKSRSGKLALKRANGKGSPRKKAGAGGDAPRVKKTIGNAPNKKVAMKEMREAFLNGTQGVFMGK